MKKFISRTMFFFVLLFFLGNIINIGSLVLFKEALFYPHYSLWIKSLENTPKLILMGSSTIRYGLSPKNICDHSTYSDGEVVNAAFDAATPIQNYYLYKEIETRLDPVATVIYGVDPWVFSKRYYRYDTRLQVYWNLPQRFYAYSKGFIFFDSVLWGKNPISSIVKLVYNSYKKHLISGHMSIPKDFGAVQLKQNPKNFNDPVATWFDYEIFEFSDLQFKYLAKMQQEIQKTDKTFILLFPPKASGWRKDYRTQCQEIEGAFLEKLHHYLPESIIAGRVDDIPADVETDLFNDGIHLNAKGQEYYSHLFAKQYLPEIHVRVSEKSAHAAELSTEPLMKQDEHH